MLHELETGTIREAFWITLLPKADPSGGGAGYVVSFSKERKSSKNVRWETGNAALGDGASPREWPRPVSGEASTQEVTAVIFSDRFVKFYSRC